LRVNAAILEMDVACGIKLRIDLRAGRRQGDSFAIPGDAMAKLDAFDLRILACLQEDASLPLAELSEAVGLSATPCWRRVQKLEAAGYIRKRVALLDRSKLQAGVTVFIAVKTARHSMEWLERFHAAVRDLPEIVDFYRMSGDIDYLLKACVPRHRRL
jgi:Lrp/AsnC family transcriptional regulator